MASSPRTPGDQPRLATFAAAATLRVKRAIRSRLVVLLQGHRMWQVVTDALLVAAAYWLAFFVRFDSGTPAIYERMMFETIGMVVAIKVSIFIATRMYDKWWRYLSVKDMEAVLKSVVAASGFALAYVYLVHTSGFLRIPRSVAVLDFAFTLFLIAGVRFAARSWFERPTLLRRQLIPAGKSVLVAGAGEAGRIIIRELQRGRLGMAPLGLVDDDDRKQQMRLDGVPVIGTTYEIADIIANSRVDEVIIAMPSATGETVQRIVEVCRASDVRCRTLPSIHEMVAGQETLTGQLREVQVEDVLGREPILVDLQRIAEYLTDQVVVVTGAGGSIGSELCRQIARINPSLLVLVDHAENNLFMIEQELRLERGFEDIVPVLGNVNDAARMRQVFEQHKPNVVFHAAAYKHVPMMELNPIEAVRNNALATKRLCHIAEVSGVDRFVLVSTDKAVEPQTVMGQSKALAEWVVQSFAARSFHTQFMAVRFGNVLGSSGSVVPIFRRQIERGGPVTVTDERMTRFFMTIPEAVQLIVQAGALGSGGEVFVLDMGKPVKIIDLARNMIELSGRKPDEDVRIEVVGIRPGEKLHEELFAGDETVELTSHEKIWQAHSAHVLDADTLLEELEELELLVEEADAPAMCSRLRAIMRPRIEAGALHPGNAPMFPQA